jgi:hypothetical protein
MKNTNVSLGVLAVVMTFGLALVGCQAKNNGGGSNIMIGSKESFTLNDIQPAFEGKYAMVKASLNDETVILGAKEVNMDTMQVKLPQIADGSVVIPLFALGEDAAEYAGNDIHTVQLLIFNVETVTVTNLGYDPWPAFTPLFNGITFTDGISDPVSWNDRG